MFARNVSVRLKPNSLTEFNQAFDKEVVTMLRQQPGFRDLIAIASDDQLHVTSISLWDSREQADAYNTGVYPAVLKSVEKFVDGTPKVRISSVIASTSHKAAPAAVAAA